MTDFDAMRERHYPSAATVISGSSYAPVSYCRGCRQPWGDDGCDFIQADDARRRVVEAARRLVSSVQDLETVDDDGETATFLVVPPEPLERARAALAESES